LIQDDNEMIFVAKIPGREDLIDVKFEKRHFRIKGGRNFAEDILLRSTNDMSISDCKYRNEVLTLRIHCYSLRIVSFSHSRIRSNLDFLFASCNIL
jgi:autonomous glycyl radical cofactor GrcA